MRGIKFKEQTKTIGPPAGMTEEECYSLAVWSDGKQCISRWKGTWKDRLKFLFTGKLWLSVLFGESQPPVWIGTEHPFEKEKK